MLLRCRSRTFDLSRPIVMGVLNVTPDSFSDGGRYASLERAVEHAESMVGQGAALIDVGGESTRPGAESVSEAEELSRVIPVIEALRARIDVPISIDTSKPGVMIAAVESGAELINDVYALRAPGALEAAVVSGAAVCLMHMQGQPRTMQAAPHYANVVAEVREFLRARVDACSSAGMHVERICVDPGIGFGKRLEHNIELLANLSELDFGRPLLIGVSRKSMFGALLTRGEVEQRLPGALAAAAASVLAGARIIRTHDVRETCDAIAVAAALKSAQHEATA